MLTLESVLLNLKVCAVLHQSLLSTPHPHPSYHQTSEGGSLPIPYLDIDTLSLLFSRESGKVSSGLWPKPVCVNSVIWGVRLNGNLKDNGEVAFQINTTFFLPINQEKQTNEAKMMTFEAERKDIIKIGHWETSRTYLYESPKGVSWLSTINTQVIETDIGGTLKHLWHNIELLLWKHFNTIGFKFSSLLWIFQLILELS